MSNINHPKHYNMGSYETIDVIEDWGLNFNLGNAVKYISRAQHKGRLEEDLNKAIWYLKREKERIIKNRTLKQECEVERYAKEIVEYFRKRAAFKKYEYQTRYSLEEGFIIHFELTLRDGFLLEAEQRDFEFWIYNAGDESARPTPEDFHNECAKIFREQNGFETKG